MNRDTGTCLFYRILNYQNHLDVFLTKLELDEFGKKEKKLTFKSLTCEYVSTVLNKVRFWVSEIEQTSHCLYDFVQKS